MTAAGTCQSQGYSGARKQEWRPEAQEKGNILLALIKSLTKFRASSPAVSCRKPLEKAVDTLQHWQDMLPMGAGRVTTWLFARLSSVQQIFTRHCKAVRGGQMSQVMQQLLGGGWLAVS